MNKCGYSLIELIIGVGISAILALGTGVLTNTVVKEISSTTKRVNILITKAELMRIFQDSEALEKSLESPDNTSFNCLRAMTSCSALLGNPDRFTLLNRAGDVVLNGAPDHIHDGFTSSGRPCNTFGVVDPDTGELAESGCVLRYEAKWEPICSGSCIQPTRKFTLQVLISPDFKGRRPASQDVTLISTPKLPVIESLSGAMDNHTVLYTDGRMKSWGGNVDRATGTDSTLNYVNQPRWVVKNDGSLARGQYMGDGGSGHNCFIGRDTKVYCMGLNTNGDLGLGTEDPVSVKYPKAMEVLDEDGVTPLSGVVYLDLAWWSANYAETNDGRKLFWGSNHNDRFAQGNTWVNYSLPTPFSVPWAEKIQVGSHVACAVVDVGAYLQAVTCWGKNEYGEFGDDSSIDELRSPSLDPDKLVFFEDSAEPIQGVVEMQANDRTFCALTNLGKVGCWGYNEFGQGGAGCRDARLLQAKHVKDQTTGFISQVRELFVGNNHACVIKEDGRVHCWGENTSGQLGRGHNDLGDNGDETYDSAFAEEATELNGFGKFIDLHLTGEETCGLLDDRKTVVCVGRGQTSASIKGGLYPPW